MIVDTEVVFEGLRKGDRWTNFVFKSFVEEFKGHSDYFLCLSADLADIASVSSLTVILKVIIKLQYFRSDLY